MSYPNAPPFFYHALKILQILIGLEKCNYFLIDDIDTEIIAMHYGIVWGERQRVFPQDFPLILWEYSLSFPPYNTIMHCDNFSIDIVYCSVNVF